MYIASNTECNIGHVQKKCFCKYCWSTVLQQYCKRYCLPNCWFSKTCDKLSAIMLAALLEILLIDNISKNIVFLFYQKYCWKSGQQYCPHCWTKSYLWRHVSIWCKGYILLIIQMFLYGDVYFVYCDLKMWRTKTCRWSKSDGHLPAWYSDQDIAPIVVLETQYMSTA